MSATGFSDDYNATFLGNESLGHSDVNRTGRQRQEPVVSWDTIHLLTDVIRYTAVALGIPGNVLSAIVWLRLHVASKNSSTVYLAALAINDLLYLLCGCVINLMQSNLRDTVDSSVWYWTVKPIYLATHAANTSDLLLVLSFSVERLIAVVRPLQVLRA